MNRTPEQHQVLNAWAQFGPEFFVSKMRRGWTVTVGGFRTPKVFRTKREAVAHADAAAMAFARPA